MSKPVANPTRLSRLPETEDTLGVGRMFRNARELPQEEEELPRLWWRLRTTQRMRVVRPRLFLKVALVLGVVFCLGGVVGAVVPPFWARKEQKETVVASPTPAVAPSLRRQKPRPASALLATPALPEVGADAPARVVEEPRPLADEPKPPKPAAVPAKHRARVAILSEPTPPPTPSAAEIAPQPVEPSRIAVEQALLGRAMKTLRDGHDARTALAVLAQYAEQFPDGALASEATMLHIETLLSLGLKDEALSFFDRVPLASLPNRDEQLVVRGELRAAKGRWREAEEDFNDILRDRSLPAASAKSRNIQERALWGRASARSRLGDQDGARTDLDLYVRHFPAGRFAGPAAALLKGVP